MSGPAPPRVSVDLGLRDRGVGTLLAVGVMGVVLVLGFTLVVVAAYLAAAHQARVAADLAAVSAATRISTRGADGCAEARRSARTNGAEVRACSRVGDQIDFVVSVEVAVPAALGFPGLPDHVSAVAHAGPGATSAEGG